MCVKYLNLPIVGQVQIRVVTLLFGNFSYLIKEFHGCSTQHCQRQSLTSCVALLYESAVIPVPATKLLAVKDLAKLVPESFSCQAGKACRCFFSSDSESLGVSLSACA